jgi:hypothetical protein
MVGQAVVGVSSPSSFCYYRIYGGFHCTDCS